VTDRQTTKCVGIGGIAIPHKTSTKTVTTTTTDIHFASVSLATAADLNKAATTNHLLLLLQL